MSGTCASHENPRYKSVNFRMDGGGPGSSYVLKLTELYRVLDTLVVWYKSVNFRT